jgi:hypothetical protein
MADEFEFRYPADFTDKDKEKYESLKRNVNLSDFVQGWSVMKTIVEITHLGTGADGRRSTRTTLRLRSARQHPWALSTARPRGAQGGYAVPAAKGASDRVS